MSIYEYDEEMHMRQTRAEGFEDGYGSGYDNGFDDGEIAGRIKAYQELSVPKDEVEKKIVKMYSLSKEQAEDMVKKYWEY